MNVSDVTVTTLPRFLEDMLVAAQRGFTVKPALTEGDADPSPHGGQRNTDLTPSVSAWCDWTWEDTWPAT